MGYFDDPKGAYEKERAKGIGIGGLTSFLGEFVETGIEELAVGLVDLTIALAESLPVIGDIIDFIGDINDLNDRLAELDGIQTTSLGNVKKIPVIYGQNRIGGTIVFIGSSGADNAYLHMVVALCEGEIESIDDVYIDDVSVSDARYSGFIEINKDPAVSRTRYGYVGTTTQAADLTMVADILKWTTAHQLKGVAYVAIKLQYNKDLFSGIPRFKFDIRGKRVYDPRDTNTKYSTNNALCLLDYMTNTVYGKGLSLSQVEVTTAANICDTTMDPHIDTPTGYLVNQAGHAADDKTIVVDTGSNAIIAGDSFIVPNDTTRYFISDVTGSTLTYLPPARTAFADNAALDFTINVYSCDGVINTERRLLDNMKLIMASCLGYMPKIDGVYTLNIKQDETPAFTFDKSNIVGGWSFKDRSKSETVNKIKARFANPGQNWASDIVVVDSAAYLAEDNGVVLEKEIPMLLEKNPYRALHRANTALKDSREGISVSFTSTIAALDELPGNVVKITHSTPGWTEKLFRIISMRPTIGGNIQVSLKEHNADVYDRTVPVGIPSLPDTDLPDATTIQPPTGLVLSSGTSELVQGGDGTIISRIKLSFTPPDNVFCAGFKIEFKRQADADFISAPPVDDRLATVAYVYSVDDGETYDVRIKAINDLGISSIWTTGTHTVIGKTEKPADVTGWSVGQNGITAVFRWSTINEVDTSGYSIRYGETAVSWEDASPLTDVTRGTRITTADLPPGEWDILIKAVDTSGNESVNEARDSIIFINDYDIISQIAQAPDWPGTLTNTIKHWTGKLLLDDQNLANTYTNAELFETYCPTPFALAYYESPEVDLGFDDTVRHWAEIESYLGPGETSGVADPQYEINHKLDGGAYEGWHRHGVGNDFGRYFKQRIVIDTTIGKPVVTAFTPTIDQLEHTERQTDVTISAGGTTIVYARPLHVAPLVKAYPKGSSALFVTVDSVTTTQATIYVFNASGTDVGGIVDIEITGV